MNRVADGTQAKGADDLNVLLIEDNDQHAKIVFRHLRRVDHLSVVRKRRLDDGLKYVAQDGIDLILLDLRLPDSDLDETLQKTLTACPYLPVVVLSSFEDQEFAKALVNEGAQDYLCKSQLSEELLLRAIYYAKERKQTEKRLRREAELKEHLYEISQIGFSAQGGAWFIKDALEIVTKALDVECGVLFEALPQKNAFKVGGRSSSAERLPTDLQIRTTELLPAGLPVKHPPSSCIVDTCVFQSVLGNDAGASRLLVPSCLQELGIESGSGASVSGRRAGAPYGILAAFSRAVRIFSKDELFFLKSAANLVAASIQRFDLEARLRRNVEELNEAHRRKDEFLSILSHELRTPLGVIMGYTDLLKELPNGSPEFDHAIEVIARNARSELRLVNDTLDMSRIITGRFTLKMECFSVEKILENALSTVLLAAKSKNIEIIKEIDDQVGDFIGDEDRLQQVLWNLLTNAVKFTPEGGQVFLRATQGGSRITLEVEDSGEGIEPAELGNVFERFWQEDTSSSRRHSGLGLGLSIVKHIVEAHGGTVSVVSEGKGCGTRFIVTLPANTSTVLADEFLDTWQPARNPADEMAQTKTKGRLNGMRVLLVEDSEEALMLFRYFLASEAAVVESFDTAHNALARFHERPDAFDIVVSDIGLPGMNGYELMKEIRRREPDLPAIALTAFASPLDASKALQAGFDLHLTKPVCKDELVREVERMVLNP